MTAAASIGVAMYSGRFDVDYEQIFEPADRALYRAKRARKDRVELEDRLDSA